MSDPDTTRPANAAAASPVAAAARPGDETSRPGLSARELRLLAVTFAAATGDPGPTGEQVHAALTSGDLDLPTLLEFDLQVAVYLGWPRAAELERVVAEQEARIAHDNGREPEPWPVLPDDDLGENDWTKRLDRAEEVFKEVNQTPGIPLRNSPYRQVGVLGFVFGHLWQRPGLTRRERRIVCIGALGTTVAPTALRAQLLSALRSGDLTGRELHELADLLAQRWAGPAGAALHEEIDTAVTATARG